MDHNTLSAKWTIFEMQVIPAEASLLQRAEMRKTFYAGAGALLSMQLLISQQELSCDAGAAMIDAWRDEISAFFANSATL